MIKTYRDQLGACYCGAVLKKGHPYQVSFGTGAGWSGLDEGALFTHATIVES